MAFGSKENLYVEAVQRYSIAANALIWDHIDDGPTVRAGMEAVLRGAAMVLAGTAGPSGCLVTLAAGEESPGEVPEITRSARRDSLAKLRTGLERAVATGELPTSANAERLARFYLSVVQGMAVQGRDGASQEALEGMAQAAMAAWPGAAAGG